MRKTIIDIGTNTMLMLIADYINNEVITVLDVQRTPRLGENVDEKRNILPSSFEKAVRILNEYKQISSEHKSESITVTATSFIRDANNKTEFVSAVKEQTGLRIEILAGEDEAKWTFSGGVYDKLQSADGKTISLIDIGGGSTEIITSEKKPSQGNINELLRLSLKGKSIDIGAVRIKEKFMNSIPSTKAEIESAKKYISEILEQIDFITGDSVLTGVAGTVTTLGAIKLGLSQFESNKVDGLILSARDIDDVFNNTINYPLSKLESIGSFMKGRADILIPGILILQSFMKKFAFDKIIVSTKGLRYGIFLREVFK